MKNKVFIRVINDICLFLMLFIGSMVTYFAMNLFWSDVANADNGFNWPLTLATLPMLMLSLSFVAFAIFLVRYLGSESQYRLKLVRLYSIILASFSLVGLVTAILSGTVVYDSFFAPCPFPGAILVYVIIHGIFLITNIIVLFMLKQTITEKDIKAKITVKYALYTVLIALLTFIAFDRAGAAFMSPMYIEWNRLDLTWSFYLSLLFPMAVLFTLMLYRLKHLRLDNYKARTITWGIFSVVCLALCLTTLLTGLNNQLFVALVSPAMPVERLATVPVDFIFLYVPTVGISIAEFVISLVKLIKEKKQLIDEKESPLA